LAITLGILWIRPDVMPYRANAVLFRLVILLAALSATGIAFMYIVVRSWSLHVQRLQEFIDASPEATADLPENGPPELERLSLAMKVTNERIRQVKDRANLESSRREAILTAMA